MRSFAFVLAAALAGQLCADPTIAELRRTFANPPDDARIMMRWWWFGPAVEKPELERELQTMKAAGIGGVEIQPVYPLALDDPARSFRNLPYLSDEFLDAVRFSAAKARELGLRVDITLASGWPYGGPGVPVSEAAGRLRCERVPVPAYAKSIPMPALENGESFIAAFVVRGYLNERLSESGNGRLTLASDSSPRVVLCFIASRTGQQVKRAAVGAEGFVVDHYDRASVEHYLHHTADRLMRAFGPNPPYAVFSDSLEVYGSDWTPRLVEEFRKRRGYDLTPFLPALVISGESTRRLRHDWGQTLTELSEENYLRHLREWAARHHTRFRSQTYGIPPVILSSNALVDLPEGEGSAWREFSTTRWASSASHLYGRNVTSSETWTWLHSPAFRATPLDLKAEADRHFLQGVNQIVGHGWPYSPPGTIEPGWRFYAAAALNEHNPWWIVMPEIARYLQRVSWLLRQGKPVNDVALYLPTDDAWSSFEPGRVSVNQAMPALLGPDLIPKILEAGLNFDFIDDRAIGQIGIPYAIIVIPESAHVPAGTQKKLEDFERKGGIVLPAARIADLAGFCPPDLSIADPAIGFVHRKLDQADIYFIANTGNQSIHSEAHVRAKGQPAEWWDPDTGRALQTDPAGLQLDLAPYQSLILVLFSGPAAGPPRPAKAEEKSLDLNANWRVQFPKLHRTEEMAVLCPWPESFYSGEAIYEKEIEIPAGFLDTGRHLFLDFGHGTAMTPVASKNPGMRAWLDSPIREAAVISINGQRAGTVWHPPYELEITTQAEPGKNAIRIVVANTAINALSGQNLPDYRLLNLRYGERFSPQDMKNLEPLPSGLLGPMRLISR